MLNLFQRTPVHVKIYPDKIEIINLKTGQSAVKTALMRFSSPRLVVADYNKAEQLCRDVVKELGLAKGNLKVLIQQMQLFEDGLCETEKRVMRDLAEQIGGVSVALVIDDRPLSTEEALQIVKEM